MVSRVLIAVGYHHLPRHSLLSASKEDELDSQHRHVGVWQRKKEHHLARVVDVKSKDVRSPRRCPSAIRTMSIQEQRHSQTKVSFKQLAGGGVASIHATTVMRVRPPPNQ